MNESNLSLSLFCCFNGKLFYKKVNVAARDEAQNNANKQVRRSNKTGGNCFRS